MFNTYIIALIFFHLSKLSLSLDKCSQDATIRCNFKYFSNKNCNRIGKPCTSFRQLNWANSSVDEYSCLTNGDFTNILSYDVDEFGLCDNVGLKSFTGKYGQNCYCDTDKVVTISSTVTFTTTVDYTLRRQPTISPTSRPTTKPTRAPSSTPTSIPSPAPTPTPSLLPTYQYPLTIPNVLNYFTDYCGGSIGWENLINGYPGTNIKKCKFEDANKDWRLTPTYYLITSSFTATQGSTQIGTVTKMYFACGNFEIYAASNNQLLYSNLPCDGVAHFLNLPNVDKYVRVLNGGAELMLFD